MNNTSGKPGLFDSKTGVGPAQLAFLCATIVGSLGLWLLIIASFAMMF